MQNTPPVENAPGPDTPLYAREFPGFELDFKLPEGFEDTSWHNNETPSFDKVQPDGTILKLWVDYADRGKSTCRRTTVLPFLARALYSGRGMDRPTRLRSTPQEALEMVVQFDGV